MLFPSLTDRQDRRVAFAVLGFGFLLLVFSFLVPGTGDEGDSLMHYYYARYAFRYPAHFFDHWAKPLYVLVAAPFAQLGFWGLKLMNLLLATANLWLCYRLARQLLMPRAWLAPLALAFIPMNIVLTYSGLTEPLFAFVLLLGILQLAADKWYPALIILSFLPFVRSEGLVICLLVLLYLLYKEKYSLLPVLGLGHIVYSLLGYPVHRDLLWVFNKMSYATWGSAYGRGNWGHFFNRLPETAGALVAVLVFAGMFSALILLLRWLRRKTDENETKRLFLVYGVFFSYFLAHTVFWALGIFNSMGLLRVMVGIMPFMALVALAGMDYICSVAEPWPRAEKIMRYVFIFLLVVYPFSGHVFGYKWQRDFGLKADQKAQARMADFIKEKYPDYKNFEFYYEPCYPGVVLGQNWFDEKQHRRLLGAFERNQFQPGCFIIWDDWFAVVEGHVALEPLEKDGRFEKIQVFEEKDYWGKTRTSVLFRKKP